MTNELCGRMREALRLAAAAIASMRPDRDQHAEAALQEAWDCAGVLARSGSTGMIWPTHELNLCRELASRSNQYWECRRAAGLAGDDSISSCTWIA